eukprot:INCI17150.1.p1 GENE.INCI17150.1~~INCI17150.1.p1  ORF type:complete len:615 (+),score=86.14 INCI17150.1:267-2111(+)
MPTTTNDILHGATRGAKYNVILQVLFRIITFAMNAVVLRFVSKATLGIANVRLMLLYTTALLFSREAIRKASLDLRPRYERGEHAVDVVQCRNLSWASVPAGIVVTAVLSYIWTSVMYAPELQLQAEAADVLDVDLKADGNNADYYVACVLCYSVSVLLELLCDSLYIRCQNEMLQQVCVVVEGIAILVRAGVTVGLAVLQPGLGIVAFGLGQLAFSATLCVAYFSYFVFRRGIPIADLFPSYPKLSGPSATPGDHPKANNPSLLPPGSVPLALSLFKQSALKQFLTEGERFLMTIVANINFEAQGVYDVVCNLGALAARFVFKPVEESYYVFFAKIISRDDHETTEQGDDNADDIHHHRHRTTFDDLLLAASTLSTLLWFVSFIGVTVLTYGQAYSRTLLHLYGGQNLSTGPGATLLRTYCVYVLALAVNGIAECFVFATAPTAYLSFFNRVMVGLSVAFLAACWCFTVFLDLGAVGFILANCVNMGLRILHHIYYISGFFSKKQKELCAVAEGEPGAQIVNPLLEGYPAIIVLLSFVGAYLATAASERLFVGGADSVPSMMGILKHIAVGAACLAVQAVLVYVTDRPMLLRVKNLLLGRGSVATVAPTSKDD